MKNPVKKALTKTIAVKGSRGRIQQVEVPPNQKLVYGMYFTVAALIGLTALEIAHMAFLRSWNSEIFAAITGLIGTITGILISQKT